ncbi:COX15/CtaA family protein [Cytobacillus oceanisediminis]|uniref:COX15/CtaA family protein n=1 Tax=Cytobacillus oceanisediminis TaxID=665099 RepID=UPI002550EEAE|nr:COX15/CtaA family protein [Cytobacillus oceanisediminis]MDK7669338.1 COX15/CtaA family protein [Cytobacillus oceanisediminis]
MKNLFSKITIISTLFALILGNLVVATNSGDACGTDWPKCNGQYIPDFTNINVLIEYSHRIFTTSLGFILLLNAILVSKKLKKSHAKSWWPLVTIILLIVQSLVGGINVLLGTPIGFTTIDVTVSLLLLVSVIYTHTLLESPKEGPKIDIKKGAYYLLIITFIEIIIGAFFKHSRMSELLYPGPTHALINSRNFSQMIYSIHGILGLASILMTAYLLFLSYKHNNFKIQSTLLMFFLLITAIFGLVTKISFLSPVTSSIHMISTILSIAVTCLISADRKGIGI